MRKTYEAPELTLVGTASEVVMGAGIGGFDAPHLGASDFEFEEDSL